MAARAEPIPAEMFPPGVFIREELESRGWTQQDFADIIGKPEAAISKIIRGKRALTPDTARLIGIAFGTGAETWLSLEAKYRAWLCSMNSAVQHTDILRRARIHNCAPISELVNRQWIKRSSDLGELEAELCKFFDVESLEHPPKLAVAARKSTSYSSTTSAQLAWMCRARTLAGVVHAAPFNHAKFVKEFPRIRALAADVQNLAAIPALLSDWGIRLVVVQHLSHTRIDGAVIWTDEYPIVALSGRFDRVDSIWHTLIHELVHVKHEHRAHVDTDLVADSSGLSDGDSSSIEEEVVANEEAADLLIPADEMSGFLLRRQGRFTEASIIQFANRMRIHPGIIVGQIQHRTRQFSRHRKFLMQGQVREILTSTTLTDGWGQTPGCD